MRRTPALAASLLAAALAGCGASGTAEPTQLAPAGSLVYGEVALEPEGEQKQGVDALKRKFPAASGRSIDDLLDKGLRESDAGLSYTKDVKPWLGKRAAFFVGGLDRRGRPDDAAAIVETEDEDAAMDAVEKAAKGKTEDASYKDVDYKRIEGEGSAGIVQGNLVVGTERGLKSVADATEGDGSPIGDSEAYEKALEGAPEERLALVYLNTPRFLDAARGTLGSSALAPFARVFRDPYVTTVDADSEGVEFASTLPPSLSSFFLPLFGKGSDVIEGLPGDAWAALGQPDLGKTLDRYIDLFAAGVGGRDVIEQQVLRATGLDLERDITGWMKDFGLFARGNTVTSLDGALVIETSDAEASRRALRALERQLGRQDDAQVGRLTAPGGGEGFTVRDSDVPKPLHVFERDDRVVVAYGNDAARDALDADEPLGDAPEFDAAASSLGDGYQVSTYVAIKPIIDLVDSTESASDRDWQRAKPYLEPFGALVGGTRQQGDKLISKVRLTLP